MSQIEEDILLFLENNTLSSSATIAKKIESNVSLATVKRVLQKLILQNKIVKKGSAKNTRYILNDQQKLLGNIDVEAYFKKEIDERIIKQSFNFDLIKKDLLNINLFTTKEINELNSYQKLFEQKSKIYTKYEWLNEMERLAIDLSWKSSQIEGNTYSLLETELLLKEKKTANGKTKDEATMLLNHKDAIDFIVEHPNYIHPLKISTIENIHSILVKELNVSKNIRQKKVAISGTNYLPLDNEWQIKDSINEMCSLINSKEIIFEKALLLLILISYIQPFMDGNKRTARIVSNAILMQANYCPLSFRTVSSIDYKKAMLIFYETNNLHAIKKIFIDQFKFAVNTYF